MTEESLRVPQRDRDGHPHVGQTELSFSGPVDEVDQAVHDRLRVDDDLDLVIRDVEEVMQLDHLERLVHHRRRVDRDLGAHLPCRMLERILNSYVAKFLERELAEGSARARPAAAPDGGEVLAPAALPDG